MKVGWMAHLRWPFLWLHIVHILRCVAEMSGFFLCSWGIQEILHAYPFEMGNFWCPPPFFFWWNPNFSCWESWSLRLQRWDPPVPKKSRWNPSFSCWNTVHLYFAWLYSVKKKTYIWRRYSEISCFFFPKFEKKILVVGDPFGCVWK